MENLADYMWYRSDISPIMYPTIKYALQAIMAYHLDFKSITLQELLEAINTLEQRREENESRKI